MPLKIATYIINLKTRPERKAAVLKEFGNRPEFAVTVVEAIRHERGLEGLWQTMKHIVRDLAREEDEYILICQDDHEFTEHYSAELLRESIAEAAALDADLLLGGVSWFQTAFRSSQHLFWTEKFSGLQFAVVFRKFFAPFLRLELDGFDAGDYRISAYTNRKWVMWPFISRQKDYGYSDVTLRNNRPERQEGLFARSMENMKTLVDITEFYNRRTATGPAGPVDAEGISIPAFIINLPERTDRREHVLNEFNGKAEFQATLVDAVRDPVGAVGLWKTIRNIVAAAVENDEDVIIISEDDHCFTPHYDAGQLMTAIFQGHHYGADLLIGGCCGGFKHVLPVTERLCWVDAFYATQFIVLYSKLFPHILAEPYDESVTADGMLSRIATNKLVLYPFISLQKEFGYSDINQAGYHDSRHVNMFRQAEMRFERVVGNFSLYGQGILR